MNLHLPDDLTGHASAVKLLLAQCPDKGPKVHKSSKVLKLESGGTTITQINAICKAIGRESCPDLIGASEAEAAQVHLQSSPCAAFSASLQKPATLVRLWDGCDLTRSHTDHYHLICRSSNGCPLCTLALRQSPMMRYLN